ncbi:MAG: SURF1 family protein [Gammaproteobacteria bacterium]|nr:SURF1 family protein [Gammaproteobacteria bacterium]NNJ72883.1 SURF1 family protein [Enterobacterales bacterium]
MNIRLGKLKISLPALIVVILAVSLLLNLGVWQLQRADEKRLIENDIANRKTQAPIELSVLESKDDKAYYHVRLTGYFENDKSLFLDNRIINGQPGYEVLQPLVIDHRSILVNRGWIPWARERNVLPEIPNQSGIRTITGIVYIPGDAFVLEEDKLDAKSAWPKLIQALDMQKIQNVYADTGLNIDTWVLREDPDNQDFYTREWTYVSMPPARHVSYAVTWFGLALALVTIYLVVLIRTKEKDIG